MDHCCKGWDIELGKDTIINYRNSTSEKIKKIASQSIIITENSLDNWGIIRLNNNGFCAFLDDDRLCKVHKILGEEALSNTCSIYPRLYGTYKYEIRSNLALSCPEAVRNLLFTPDAMLYSERIKLSNQALDAHDISPDARLLNLMSANLMKNSGVCVESGLYGNLILLICYTDSRQDNDLHEKLLLRFDEIITSLNDGSVDYVIKSFESDEAEQLSLLECIKKHFDTYHEGRGSSTLKDYIKNLDDVLNVSGLKEIDNVISPISKLKDIWEKQATPWLSERKQVITNYFQYRIYEDLFPMKENRDVFISLTLLTAEWIFIKALISACIAIKSKIDEDDIIKIIYSYHSISKHDKLGEEKLLKAVNHITLKNHHSLLQMIA